MWQGRLHFKMKIVLRVGMPCNCSAQLQSRQSCNYAPVYSSSSSWMQAEHADTDCNGVELA